MITYEYKMKPTLWRRNDRANLVTNKAPICLRIDIEGFVRAEYLTSIKATGAEWNVAAKKILPPSPSTKQEQQVLRTINKAYAPLHALGGISWSWAKGGFLVAHPLEPEQQSILQEVEQQLRHLQERFEWEPYSGTFTPLLPLSKEEQRELEKHNKKLSQLLEQLDQAYNAYKTQGGNPSPGQLRDLLRGGRSADHDEKTLMAVMQLLYKKKEVKGRRSATLANIQVAVKMVEDFLAYTKQPRMAASEAKIAWAHKLELWCMAKPWAGSTIRLNFKKVQEALDMAVKAGLIPRNEMKGYSFESDMVLPEKRHLSQEEVERIASYSFPDIVVQRVAHMFLFCCYTGLVYADYTRFARAPDEFIVFVEDSHGRLVKGFKIVRQKVHYLGREHWVPLFPAANALLEVYTPQGGLPIYSKSCTNKKLKEVARHMAAVAPFSLPDLSHKDARSTFTQYMRDISDKKLSALTGMHSEEVNEKYYSSESATEILKGLYGFDVKLTYN